MAAGQCGRVAHQLRRDGERRAWRDRNPAHRAGLWVVVPGDHLLGVGEDCILLLDHAVGRQPAPGLAQRHRAAARVKADAELARHLHERLEKARPAVRKDVVVIGGEGASAQEQLRHRGACRDAHAVCIDACPHRVERAQPLEERAVGNVAARCPLVHVVVRVDKPRHGDAVGLVDDLARLWRRTGSDPDDLALAHMHPAVLDLACAGVDQSGLQEKAQRVMSCGRTGTRLMSRPVAARMAATIAGPEEIVGGSPTPFKP